MPIDPELRRILDEVKALGLPAVEMLTPEEARAHHHTRHLKMHQPMPEYADVTVEARDVVVPWRAIPVRVYTPQSMERDAGPEGSHALPVVVFFHGGGWVTGTLHTYEPYCRALCSEARAVVISVDYRLAPEHKFSAALDDCVAAAEWALNHAAEIGGDPARVFVAGDSAGGQLATVTAMLFRDGAAKAPRGAGLAGQILLYPVTSYYEPPTPSYTEMAEGYGLTRKGMIWFWDHYLNDASEAKDFRASPLAVKSVTGLPRTFVVTAEYDVLRDEGVAYAGRLKAEGVPTVHIHAAGMNHGFATSSHEFPYLRQAKEVLLRVSEWINK